MTILDWRSLVLQEGILPEPIPDGSHIVLWLPGGRDDGLQLWERVSTVAHAEVTVEQGMCATAATLMKARQQARGFFGKVIQRIRGAKEEQTWLLPNGGAAEQCGSRQTDLVLVWAEDPAQPLDETRLKERWPQGKRFQQIGKNLYLVGGVEPPGSRNGPVAVTQQSPQEQAEKLLAAASQAGDRAGQARALTDLGVLTLHEGNAQQAAARLEEALALARQLGDRSIESDVLGNLGMATLAIGQPERARELFEQQLSHARTLRDRFVEKQALEGLGVVAISLRDQAGALQLLDQSLALARSVGDRQQEIRLLWYLGIAYATLGQRDQAIANCQAAVDLLTKTGNPQAEVFADHLQKYRRASSGTWLDGTGVAGLELPVGSSFGGSIVATVTASQSGSGSVAKQPPSGPGLLNMAFSAARAMTRYLGSGMKTVAPETRLKRLQTCAACEHHTGVRCKICGCFTNIKSRLPHEDCPIGKWPG